MTPTLLGRVQTRIFLVAIIGSLWTLVITPFLPGVGGETVYDVTFPILLVVGVAGVAWEFVYHAMQQFRWEKDWPTLFGLVTGVNEGVAAWLVVDAGLAPSVESGLVPGNAFTVHFATTWIVLFLFVNGPMRVPFLRWRFRGGRIV